MPLARCKLAHKGGFIVIKGRPTDIKPGWVSDLPEDMIALYPFLERVPVEIPVPTSENIAEGEPAPSKSRGRNASRHVRPPGR